MAHKSKDTLRLEEYCEAAGLTKKYCKQIGEISLHYYRYSWLPSMIMKETADTLPVLRDAIIMLGDRNRPYTKKDLKRAVQTISRLDLFDVLVERALESVWEDILAEPDENYGQILEYCCQGHHREPEYDFYSRVGLSKSAVYERRNNLFTAIGLAITCCAAPMALKALGEWG